MFKTKIKDIFEEVSPPKDRKQELDSGLMLPASEGNPRLLGVLLELVQLLLCFYAIYRAWSWKFIYLPICFLIFVNKKYSSDTKILCLQMSV